MLFTLQESDKYSPLLLSDNFIITIFYFFLLKSFSQSIFCHSDVLLWETVVATDCDCLLQPAQRGCYCFQ